MTVVQVVTRVITRVITCVMYTSHVLCTLVRYTHMYNVLVLYSCPQLRSFSVTRKRMRIERKIIGF